MLPFPHRSQRRTPPQLGETPSDDGPSNSCVCNRYFRNALKYKPVTLTAVVNTHNVQSVSSGEHPAHPCEQNSCQHPGKALSTQPAMNTKVQLCKDRPDQFPQNINQGSEHSHEDPGEHSCEHEGAALQPQNINQGSEHSHEDPGEHTCKHQGAALQRRTWSVHSEHQPGF